MADTPKITIYSTPTCTFCKQVKDFLTENNVEYSDFNVAEDIEKRKEMIEKSGQMGVPVVFIGEEMTIGFDESRIRELLGL